MDNRTPDRLPSVPTPAVMEEIRRHLSRREVQVLETLFALRTTAQQVDNEITEWLAGTVGSPARLQILVLLWAARGSEIPHKEIVAALGVTRATVSGLMAALEREGLVKSTVSRDDRRNLLATLTSTGNAVIGKAIETNTSRLRAVFASLTPAELTTFTAALQRVREGLAGRANATCSECGCDERAFSSRDPLTSLMMQADGVTEGDLRAILEDVTVARSR